MTILSELVPTNCIRHYSNLNVKLRQIETDELFNDAIDLLPCQFTYEETDIPIDDSFLDDEETTNILLGEAK